MDPWNILDFIVVCASLIDFIVTIQAKLESSKNIKDAIFSDKLFEAPKPIYSAGKDVHGYDVPESEN